MKKLLILAAIAGCFALTSCSSSPESDAKEFNDLVQEYNEKARNGSLDEALIKKMAKMNEKISSKYNTPEKQQEFQQALMKVQSGK